MTLYLKYRPQTIDELDLASVREALTNILKSDSVPHAFLFTGPRGSGKTSAARILAKALLCEGRKGVEPCNKCESCTAISKGQFIDVIEMDGASNRGIDDIRALRDSVITTPARAKKKVYIIDEVHMLTTEAFNAFLKTLEEPPPHVVFILATTDPQKMPETVLSRLYTVTFTKATPEEIARQLARVAKGEGLKIDKEVVGRIAKISDGSFRDAVKTIEKLAMATDTITEELLDNNFGEGKGAREIFSYLLANDRGQALASLHSAIEAGGKANEIVSALLAITHEQLMVVEGIVDGEKIPGAATEKLVRAVSVFAQAFDELRVCPEPELPLMAAIIKLTSENDAEPEQFEVEDESPPEKIEKKARKSSNGNGKAAKVYPSKAEAKFVGSMEVTEAIWTDIRKAVKAADPKVDALLSSCKPLGINDGTMGIGVLFQFHKEKLETHKIGETVAEGASTVLGKRVKLVYELVDPQTKMVSETAPNIALTEEPTEAIISAAKEIFGG